MEISLPSLLMHIVPKLEFSTKCHVNIIFTFTRHCASPEVIAISFQLGAYLPWAFLGHEERAKKQ